MTIRILVFSSGTTIDQQATKLCSKYSGLSFGTFYPGGIYSTCKFAIPSKIRNPMILQGGLRIILVDGTRTVWEGEIDAVTPIKQDSMEMLGVECTGKWGALLMRRRWNQCWVDTRLTQDVWDWVQSGTISLFQDKRDDGLFITPRVATFAANDYGGFRYTAPVNRSVNKISFDYDYRRVGATGTPWLLTAYDVTGGTHLPGTITTAGTGLFSGTPADGCKAMEIRFTSGTAQSVAGAGGGTTIYARMTNVKVYGDSAYGTVSPSNAIKDIQDNFTEINSDESNISSNALTLEPLFMEWSQTVADFLTVTSSYGDSSYNAWSAGLLASTDAKTPDGKPVIYYEQQPGTTATDYIINVNEMVSPVSMGKVYDEIANNIIIDTQDINKNQVYYTAADFSGLKSQDSIDKYGQRDLVLSLSDMGTAEAVNYAVRYKNANCYPKWQLSGQIQVKGTIRMASWGRVPVAWVRAGKRIQIENYLQEANGGYIVFVITETNYDADSDTLSISTGSPDPLAVLGAQIKRGVESMGSSGGRKK